jgi:hypothetical protein
VVAGAAELTLTGRSAIADWVARYEGAWREGRAARLGELFTDDARYLTAPYAVPFEGLAEIAELWDEDEPEVFAMSSEIVAVEGATGVVRVEVRYGEPVRQEYRDLWIVTLAADGRRCVAFEEWPFWPEGTAGTYTRGPAGAAGG